MEKRESEWKEEEEKGAQKRIRMETAEEAFVFALSAINDPEKIAALLRKHVIKGTPELVPDILTRIMLLLPAITLERWCATSSTIYKLCTPRVWAAVVFGDWGVGRVLDMKNAERMGIAWLKQSYTKKVAAEVEALVKDPGVIYVNSTLFTRPTASILVLPKPLRIGGPQLYRFDFWNGTALPSMNRFLKDVLNQWSIYSKGLKGVIHTTKGAVQFIAVEMEMDPQADNIKGIFKSHQLEGGKIGDPTIDKFVYWGTGEDRTLRAKITLALKQRSEDEFLWRIESLTYYGGKSYLAAFEVRRFWGELVKHDRRTELFYPKTPESKLVPVESELEPWVQNDAEETEDDLEWNTRSVHLLGESVTKLDCLELHTISTGESGDLSFLYNASPEIKDRTCEHNLPRDQFIKWLEYKRHKNHPCPMCDKMGTMKL